MNSSTHSSRSTNQEYIGVLLSASVRLCLSFSLVFARMDGAPPQPATRIFAITSDAGFSNYKQIVERFARNHRPQAVNDFCILGQIADDNSRSAWVIWRQGQEIILWDRNVMDLDSSLRTIRLKSDVVPTENDVRGSTYRVTRAWVETLSSMCEKSGVKVHTAKQRTAHLP